MKAGWTEVALGEVAELIRGITFKPSDVVEPGTAGSIPCFRTKNVQVHLDLTDVLAVSEQFVKRPQQILQSGDVLISSANSWNLVGKCSWVPELGAAATFGGFVTALRPSTGSLDRRFLYRWFSDDRTQTLLRSFGRSTTNISNLNLSRCREMALPLPPIEEQRRIVAVLDAADALRAKRRQAIAKLDTLTQAIFIDMFGDPVTNSMGWPKSTLGDQLSKIESGKSPVCLDRRAADGEWGVLKAGAVTYCRYDDRQSKALPERVDPDPSIEVVAGDVLFARKNTHQLVAAAAYVHETQSKLLLSDLIFRLRIGSKMHPLFLQQMLVHPRQRREIQRLAGGSSGSMPNISKAKLATVHVIDPPIDLQRRFAAHAEGCRSREADLLRSSNQLSHAFASLQQQAFRGEL